MELVTRTDYSESELISLMKLNDRAGFCQVYNKYSGALLFCIKGVIYDDQIAEDILQDVFVKIWTKIGSYDTEKSTLFTWMRRIALNTAIDSRRCGTQNMRNRTVGNEECLKVLTHCTEQKTDKIGLNQLVAKLPKKNKSVIYLVYYSGYTFTEISDILKIPLGTVKTRARNALLSLRREFA